MRVVDLFCGAGGMSYGLFKAGFRIERAYDNNPAALKVYERNMPRGVRTLGRRQHSHDRDLANLLKLAPEIARLSVDIIVGGPPCQDFSTAGKQEEGERAELTVGFAAIVCIARPQWFLMENVPGAMKSTAYSQARSLLKCAGYGLSEQVLDFSRYGVPQMRRRLIVVGRLGEADGFLSAAITAAADSRPMTLRDIFGNEVGLAPSELARNRTRRASSPADPSEARYYFIRPYKGGRGVRSVDEPVPSLLRSAGDRPAKAYRAHKRDALPARMVPSLSFGQRSRVQGFPAEWLWDDVPAARKRDLLVANAVPAPVAERLGRIILARHRGETVPETEPQFVEDMAQKHNLDGQGIRNLRHQLLRARKLLGGRVLADVDQELILLERAPGFADLSAPVKSDLRRALRRYADWRASREQDRFRELWANIAREEARWAHSDQSDIGAGA